MYFALSLTHPRALSRTTHFLLESSKSGSPGAQSSVNSSTGVEPAILNWLSVVSNFTLIQSEETFYLGDYNLKFKLEKQQI